MFETLQVSQILNNSLADITHASIRLNGINFRSDSFFNAILPFTDSRGNEVMFSGNNSVFVYEDTLTATIASPLSHTNLLYVHRVKEIVPGISEISLDSSNVATVSPNQVEVVFDTSIEYVRDIKLHLLHYLKGSYQLSVLSINTDAHDSDMMTSVTVLLPDIESPASMELYIEPILSTRVVFENYLFDFVMKAQEDDIFLLNTTVAKEEVPLYPKIYKVSPIKITDIDTKITIEGVELTENIY